MSCFYDNREGERLFVKLYEMLHLSDVNHGILHPHSKSMQTFGSLDDCIHVLIEVGHWTCVQHDGDIGE